jgi:hypothetical protein
VGANLEDDLVHGFGLTFIYQTMDQTGYETARDGNQQLPNSKNE